MAIDLTEAWLGLDPANQDQVRGLDPALGRALHYFAEGDDAINIGEEYVVQLWRGLNPSTRDRVRMVAHFPGRALDELDDKWSGSQLSPISVEANERWHRENNMDAPFLREPVESRSGVTVMKVKHA